MVRSCLILVAVAAIAAPTQAATPEAPKLDLSTAPKGCTPASPGEVVVCGESPDKYRIDPDVLQVVRAQEQAANPPRPPAQVTDGDPCRIGPNGCPGEGALPLLMIAMKVVEVAAQVAKGDDWREPLRTGPDEYQLYMESKTRREKPKASIGIGIGVSGGP